MPRTPRTQERAAALPDQSEAGGGQAADRLALLQTFVRIVEAGSMSAAAPLLQTTQPTISRRLRTLESFLGVPLLQRSTHGMRLTLDGERCYEHAKVILADWMALETGVGGAAAEPEGLLRVAVPHAFGQEKFLVPLAAFLRTHPKVTVDWILEDVVDSALARGIDCIIQVGQPTDPSLVASRIAEVPRLMVVAPELLVGGKVPQDPEELELLPWLSLTMYYRDRLTLSRVSNKASREIQLRSRMGTNNLYALRNAALQGLGACAGSSWLFEEDIARGHLVQLAPDWEAAALPMWIAYPHARHYPSRLTRFVDAMRGAASAIARQASNATMAPPKAR